MLDNGPHLSRGTFGPLGRFVPWDILSHGTFCPLGHFVRGTFCPSGRFVQWDVLSVGRFVFGCFVLGRFVCASIFAQLYC